jgi:hypothetical protein
MLRLKSLVSPDRIIHSYLRDDDFHRELYRCDALKAVCKQNPFALEVSSNS